MVSACILANFGGPRNLSEIEPFLTTLLTDYDVTGGIIPHRFHKQLFTFIAKRRAQKVRSQYAQIGGRSPIYQDTEKLAEALEARLRIPVIPFHRYLPETHSRTIKAIERYSSHSVWGLPLFPYFSYAVTGSMMRFFLNQLPHMHIQWISHFGMHSEYLRCITEQIEGFLHKYGLPKEDTHLLFSAHSLPIQHIKKGDPYQKQCQLSYQCIADTLQMKSTLCFQSKFGLGKWLQPATREICATFQGKERFVLIIPLGFISDHIETLYEIEHEYIPLLRAKGYKAMRVPAIYSSSTWIPSLEEIFRSYSHFKEDGSVV